MRKEYTISHSVQPKCSSPVQTVVGLTRTNTSSEQSNLVPPLLSPSI